MKKIYTLIILFLAFIVQLDAQRSCGTMEHQHMLEQQNPAIQNRREDIEQFTQEFITHNDGSERALVTIPVVVHVVWNTSAENISDAQIQSQISVLNADFRKLNLDISSVPGAFSSLTSDANIEFCLAGVDPNGNATTGIHRVQTAQTSFGTNDQVKSTATGGAAAWPASQYLNLWVCDISGGILGYAQFPGGPASTDGVVIDYQYFGTIGTATAPYHKGRTATHEIGHWLNLYHIWGDDGTACTGSDLVNDTPNAAGSNFGCPSFPHVTCGNSPNGDMFMNYMDYTDDACMYMFSAGQTSRMQALFASGGARAGLLNSPGCGIPGTTCLTPGGRSTSGISTSAALFSWTAVAGATGYNVRYKATSSGTWTTFSSSTTSYSPTALTACTNYEWQVQTVCSATSSSAFSASSTFQTTGCMATYCASSGSTADEFINKVVLNTISNTSGNNGGYGNYTGLSTTLNKGTTYSVSLTPGFTAASYNEVFRVWIDYNGDLDFADAGELVYAPAKSAGTVTGSFTPPVTAITGTTRMRVSMQYNTASTYCGILTYGEVEDYTIILAAATTPTCTDIYESNNSSSVSKAISANTNITALIGTSTDQDWFKFTNSGSQRNIRIDLTNLPADYDVRLYTSSGTLVGISQNSGATAEVIKYNGGAIGTYLVAVYGYNGSFSASQCYTLRASTSGTVFREGSETEESVLENNTSVEPFSITLAYPNPVADKLNVRFYAPEEGIVYLQLIDITGREVLNTTFSAQAGNNTTALDLLSLPSGYYTLTMKEGTNQSTIKVVKN